MTSNINDKILKKLEKLADNPNELEICKKILTLENMNSNNTDFDFKSYYKKYLVDYFPYDESS